MMPEDKKVTLLGTMIWILATSFFLYEFFLRTFIGSVSDQVIHDFNLSINTFSWVTAAYYFSYAGMQIPVGMLLDKYSVKNILIFATTVCAFSSLCFVYSGNFVFAFLSRLLMGFGSSFGFISLLVVATFWFPRKYAGLMSGASQFIGTLGPILAAGPMVKVLTDSNLSWQSLITIIAIIGFMLAITMFLVIREKKRDNTVTIYLRREQTFLECLKILIKNPQVILIAIYSGIIYIPMTLLGGAWGIPYLKSLSFSSAQAANVISMMWLGYAVGALGFGGISDKIQRRRPILIFSALVSIVLVLGIVLPTQQSIYFYTGLFLLLGFTSAGQTVAFSTIAENVNFTTKATAMGINNMSITLLSSTTPIIAGYLIYSMHTDDVKNLLPGDFFYCFMMMVFLSAVAGLISILFIKETFCKLQKDPIFLNLDYEEST